MRRSKPEALDEPTCTRVALALLAGREHGRRELDIETALRDADVDWLATARAVRRKRFGAEAPGDFRERARQARFLEYRGFSGEQIRGALEVDGDSD